MTRFLTFNTESGSKSKTATLQLPFCLFVFLFGLLCPLSPLCRKCQISLVASGFLSDICEQTAENTGRPTSLYQYRAQSVRLIFPNRFPILTDWCCLSQQAPTISSLDVRDQQPVVFVSPAHSPHLAMPLSLLCLIFALPLAFNHEFLLFGFCSVRCRELLAFGTLFPDWSAGLHSFFLLF